MLVSAFVDMESARLFPDADFFLVKDIGLDIILQRTRELLEFHNRSPKFQQNSVISPICN